MYILFMYIYMYACKCPCILWYIIVLYWCSSSLIYSIPYNYVEVSREQTIIFILFKLCKFQHEILVWYLCGKHSSMNAYVSYTFCFRLAFLSVKRLSLLASYMLNDNFSRKKTSQFIWFESFATSSLVS